ncbi:MAG: glycosyltransferase family 2 protein [Lentisphaerae bacterium]|nr:glycosyltransferase family 2 protein [Lentisphaerota bacterium]
MQAKTRTLSVVMPCFNHGAFVSQAIESVLSQSRLPDEFIILDDASTDDSAAVIEAYARRHALIRFERQGVNRGAVKTLTTLMERAKGDIVYAGGADDFVLPGLFETGMGMLEAHPQAGVFSALSLVVDRDGHAEGLLPGGVPAMRPAWIPPDEVKRRLCLYGGWFMGNTALYPREYFLREGGYLPALGAFVDGFMYHVLALRHGACFVPQPLAAWRRLETGYSSATAASQEKMSAILRESERLMREAPEYAGLFPARYVDDWLKRQQYWMEAPALRRQAAGGLSAMGYALAWLRLQGRCFTWPATPLMARWALRHAACLLSPPRLGSGAGRPGAA